MSAYTSGSVRAIRIAAPWSIPIVTIPNGASRTRFNSFAARIDVAALMSSGNVVQPNCPVT
jgi:hypothetical protein